MMQVFDDVQIVRQQSRIFKNGTNTPYFLFDWALDQIADRLTLIKREFSTSVRLGARGKNISVSGQRPFILNNASISSVDVLSDFSFMPLKPESVDFIFSALQLHTVNDLPGCLLQIKKSLKPDGLFLCAILGGETLYELRACLTQAELELSNGVTPRVAPFADKQQIGALMQRAGFSLPVVDSDILSVTYNSIYDLMADLRHMGEGNAILARKKTFTPKSLFLRAGELYTQKFAQADGRIAASFEIIFMTGWAPHESQQKPLAPGAAKNRLSDALGSKEIATGEKTH